MGKGDLTRKSNPTNPKERVGGGRVSITARSPIESLRFRAIRPARTTSGLTIEIPHPEQERVERC
jgi:hypothetical protein